MNQRIAIEPHLTPVKEYLNSKGYQVDSVEMSRNSQMQTGNYAAYVVTGMNQDFLGISNTSSKAVVIDASGLTPEQIYSELKSRLR